MKKNTASQIVGAQLVSATDGSAVTTGTTTVYVTGDGGTQAAGSVGSGACTHEGQGFWTYAPAQAETNYDHVAFTFVNTAAVNATVQLYPSFPQTGDNYARLGAPAGASVSADVAAVKSDTAAILVDTAEIGVAGAGLTVLATAANLSDVAGYLDTEIVSILADTNELQTDWANGGRLDLILDARASQTSVDDLPTNAELATALAAADDAVLTQVALVKAKTDNLPAAPAATSDVAAAWTTALTEAYAADGAAFTPAQALYMIWALLAERSIASTTLTAKQLDGSTPAMTFTLDSATTPTSQTRAT